jgi:hypothetical protein
MGAKEVSRKKFNEMLDLAMEYPTEKGPWTFDFGHLADRLPPNPASF